MRSSFILYFYYLIKFFSRLSLIIFRYNDYYSMALKEKKNKETNVDYFFLNGFFGFLKFFYKFQRNVRFLFYIGRNGIFFVHLVILHLGTRDV